METKCILFNACSHFGHISRTCFLHCVFFFSHCGAPSSAFPPSLPPSLPPSFPPSLPISFPLVSVMGVWFPLHGGSWLGGVDFQPWGCNSILGLAAKSGSPGYLRHPTSILSDAGVNLLKWAADLLGFPRAWPCQETSHEVPGKKEKKTLFRILLTGNKPYTFSSNAHRLVFTN